VEAGSVSRGRPAREIKDYSKNKRLSRKPYQGVEKQEIGFLGKARGF
jgi:ribosomal protein L34E